MLPRALSLSLLVLIVSLFLTAPALADKEQTHECVVVKAGDGKITVSKGEKEHSAPVAGDAKITLDGKDCKLEDLKKDYKVKLTLRFKEGEGVVVVKLDANSK
jgi:hypothetical protein